MTAVESRTPPQNLEAEQSVLGSILLDNEVYATLEGTLRAEHFYKESHRKLFRAMERLFRRGEPIDLVTLTEELRQGGQLDEVGNLPYLIGLADSVPTAAYAESYARIVVEKAVLRDLIGASGQIMQTAYDQAMPLEEVLDASEKAIFELASSKRSHQFGSMNELVTETFAHINELFANPDPVSGLRTGFKELDQMTSGLQPSSLNVLAARPSMGKCLTAGTLIDLPDTGERVPIEEVVRRRHGCVLGVSDTGRVRPATVTDWIDSGVQPAFRVTTRTGRRVETTGHHPFLTVHGWTPLHHLSEGDAIAVPRAVPAFGHDRSVSVARARLLGHRIAEAARAEPHTDRPAPPTAWPDELAPMGRRAEDAFLPDVVWRWDRERLAALLGALFGRAGTIDVQGAARRPRVELAVASERLASDVHHALVRFGIVATLGRALDRSWRVEIADPVSLARYHDQIAERGATTRRRPAPASGSTRGAHVGHAPPQVWTRIRSLCEARGWSPSDLARRAGQRVPPGWSPDTRRSLPIRRLAAYADALDDDALRRAASPDLHWDEIVAVEPLGPVQVYDLTVPDGSNFVAADVCVHNTALALSIGLNAALRENTTVGLFSLEMSGVQLVTRMLCSEARVDMTRVRNGQLTDRDFQRLADTAGRMSEARIFIDDHADMTVMELRSRARRLMAEHGLGLIVIDYLQLMSGGNLGRFGAENRQQEISAISRGLKALARELDVPVLVLSQLSRAVESRPNKRPMLSDLRECVPGDTLVVLADGRRRPIRELVGLRPCVVAVGEEGRLRPARADKVWAVGRRRVRELRTASGRRLRASDRHRVLTGAGWRRMDEVTPGDRIALARRLPPPTDPVRWPDPHVELLGQLIGDGSYLKGQPLRYTSGSASNLAVVRRGAQALGSTVREHAVRGRLRQLSIGGNGSRWRPAGVGAWLKELGVFDQRSHEKRVPDAAFQLADDQVGRLLRHLWAADGCIGVRKAGLRGSHTVSYATNSRGLADDVGALLLRLGIVARIAEVRSDGGRPWYRVHVSGAHDQTTFLERVGAFGPRAVPAERLAAALSGVRENPNRDTLPRERFDLVRARMRELGISTRRMAALRGTSYGGAAPFAFAPSRATLRQYARLLGDATLAGMADDDLYWDEVTAVEPAGDEEVFDLTVPGPATWLADGLVSHNSGAIEQDADLVMFIYRDEYYDPHSEKQGVAEILVGKQRNGPVGSLELQFHSAHVRFNDLARGAP
jgi:replicative DNA helicase